MTANRNMSFNLMFTICSNFSPQVNTSLTGKGVVDRIITNLGVLDVVPGGLKIVECADGVTVDEVKAATEATIVS